MEQVSPQEIVERMGFMCDRGTLGDMFPILKHVRRKQVAVQRCIDGSGGGEDDSDELLKMYPFDWWKTA